MNSKTKLALKRWGIRQIRKLVWLADEWIHAQEIKLRVDRSAIAHELDRFAIAQKLEAEQAAAGKVTRTLSQGRPQPVSVQKPGKTFEQWQADRVHDRSQREPARSSSNSDRAGIRPHPQKSRQKKRLTAAQFDSTFGLRFSR